LIEKSKMFEFIGPKWNPFGFGCMHDCNYCWAKALCKWIALKCPSCKRFEPHIHPERFQESFKDGDFVFVEDVGDAYGDWVPLEWDYKVLDFERNQPNVKFLNLTKNPYRYMQLISLSRDYSKVIPGNAIIGATIESNRNYWNLSKAPSQYNRLYWMAQLAKFDSLKGRLFICIEPILDFDLREFELMIYWIKPWAVAVGYDNYNHHLQEPPLAKTKELIEKLKGYTIVYEKKLRKAWNEDNAMDDEYKFK